MLLFFSVSRRNLFICLYTQTGRQKYSHCSGYHEDPEKCAVTYGGYSKAVTVVEDFVCAIPDNLDMKYVLMEYVVLIC